MKKNIKTNLLKYLEQRAFTSSKEIQETFSVSLMTVNRWLKELDQEGKIKKIHGGATSVNIYHSDNINIVQQKNLQYKKQIACYAAKHFIYPEQTYFFEAGGTIYEMLPFLTDKTITIITNSIRIVYSINQYLPEINVLCLGGVVRARSMSIVGDIAELTISKFKANTLFLAGKSLTEQGILDSDFFETVIKQKMIQQSNRVVLLADSSKMNTISAEFVTAYDAIDDLVTDNAPPDNIKKALEKNNVSIHIAPKIPSEYSPISH